MGKVHGRGGRAVFRGGKDARVAVGEHPVAVREERKAVFAYFPAHLNVLALYLYGLRLHRGFKRRHIAPAGKRRVRHPVDGPEEVHRRGARGFKIVSCALYFL